MRRVATIGAAIAFAAVLAAGCSGHDDDGPGAEAAGGLESGILAAGAQESLAAAGAGVSSAGITVTGTGTSAVTPDTATWSFGVQTSAETAEAALAANSEAMDRVIAALRAAGIAKEDLQTEQVSVYPRTSGNGRTIVGYDVSTMVRATIRGLEDAGTIVDAAVAAGANEVYGPSLTVSDADASYRAAVEAAFADARKRAEAIAELAGVTLGAPVAIVESGGGGGPMPYYAVEAMAADVAVEPGTQEVGASLTITFAIE